MLPECPQATRWYSRYRGFSFEEHSYDSLLARVHIVVPVVWFNKQRDDKKIPETLSSLRSYGKPYEGKLGRGSFRQNGPGWCLEDRVHQTPGTSSANKGMIVQRWNPVRLKTQWFVLIWCLFEMEPQVGQAGLDLLILLPLPLGLQIYAIMLDLV